MSFANFFGYSQIVVVVNELTTCLANLILDDGSVATIIIASKRLVVNDTVITANVVDWN